MTTLGEDLDKRTTQERRIAENFRLAQPTSGAWGTWSPAVAKIGAGTFTITGSPTYSYRLNWPKIEFKIDFHGTVVGAITAVQLTLPTDVVIPAVNHFNAVILDWAGGYFLGKCVISDANITITEYNGGAWPAGTCGLHNVIVSAALTSDTVLYSSSGAATGLTAEEVRDLVATFLVAGTNITLTHDDPGDTLTVASSGAAPTIPSVEVDLGSTPRRSGKFSISTTGLTANKPVFVMQGNGPYTGKGTLADEAEMDGLIVSGRATSTTNIDCYWKSGTMVKGNFKFNYMAGA